ncbi:MAG: prolyl oligopeptidase family serine peptidase [Pseudomonadota bacterium]
MHWWPNLICIALLPLTLATLIAAEQADQATAGPEVIEHGQVPTYAKVSVDGQSHQIAIYAPTGEYERLPVVLFLHGAGERGADLDLAASVGLPHALESMDQMPAIYVVPQVPESQWWSDPANLKLALSSLEHAISAHRGNRNQLYMLGISMGGHGALQIAARYPDVFAAVVAICPRIARPNYLYKAPGVWGSAKAIAPHLRDVPLWLFHGDKDPIVPVGNSSKLDTALNKLGAPVRYTEYPGADHNIWNMALDQPEVLQWMFTHTRQHNLPEF